MQQKFQYSTPPIFLRLTFHRWRFRVLDLDPMRGAARAIWGAKPLRDDALATEFAGVREQDVAIALEGRGMNRSLIVAISLICVAPLHAQDQPPSITGWTSMMR
jgi:hypothetical protein